MTKVIAVLRHAQSAGKQTGQQDYDRMLSPRGEAVARTLGQKLLSQNFNLDLILSSSSRRTTQTVELINESLQLPIKKTQFKSELYEAHMATWLDYIHELPNDVNRVMLVGHNPWLSMLASHLAGSICDLAACELIAFEFEVDLWKELISPGREILHVKQTNGNGRTGHAI